MGSKFQIVSFQNLSNNMFYITEFRFREKSQNEKKHESFYEQKFLTATLPCLKRSQNEPRQRKCFSKHERMIDSKYKVSMSRMTPSIFYCPVRTLCQMQLCGLLPGSLWSVKIKYFNIFSSSITRVIVKKFEKHNRSRVFVDFVVDSKETSKSRI